MTKKGFSQIDRLLEQLGHYAEAEKPANIRRACRSTALELIYAYCFATHEDFVTAPDFSHRFVVESELTFPLFHWYIHFPGCTSFFILKSLVASWFKPNNGVLWHSYTRLKDKIHQLREHPELVEHEEHETVLQQMLIAHPDKGQTEIPSEQVLWEEAITLIAAGSETVASVVNVGVFHVLNNPDIHAKLVEELKCAWPELETTMRYDRLEKLPYLVRHRNCYMQHLTLIIDSLLLPDCGHKGVSPARAWGCTASAPHCRSQGCHHRRSYRARWCTSAARSYPPHTN